MRRCQGRAGGLGGNLRRRSGSSVRRQLKAAYNKEGRNAGLPENLFCKTTPTVLTRLATGLSAAGEGRFYRQIRPELNIEAPNCYHSAWDRKSGALGTPFQRSDCDQGGSFL